MLITCKSLESLKNKKKKIKTAFRFQEFELDFITVEFGAYLRTTMPPANTFILIFILSLLGRYDVRHKSIVDASTEIKVFFFLF